jgi:O-antigen/teichoic acid export membrane protein
VNAIRDAYASTAGEAPPPVVKRSLRFNVLLNLGGQVAPLAAGLLAMPVLVRVLGAERIGLLTIAWVLIGYFGLFDLGIGRAMTRHISAALAKDRTDEGASIALTGLVLMSGLGVVAALALLAAGPWLGGSAVTVSESLQLEVKYSLYVLAAGIPLTIASTGLTAVLEAHEQFLTVNLIKIPLGLLLFLGPVAAVSISSSLVLVVLSLVLCRLGALVALLVVCRELIGRGVSMRAAFRGNARLLLSFGGWLTVSNIIGPVMLYADRFFIAAMVSLAAVAYYTVPFDVITKALIVPSAILGVMFPAFVRAQAQGADRSRSLYLKTQLTTGLLVLPIVAGVLLFSSAALRLWLGDDYARNSALVAQVLIVGVLMNSFGLVSQAFVQASGRPDLTAKLHMFELPLYVAYLILLLRSFGIVGAAMAWAVRTSLSALVLAGMAHWTIGSIRKHE